MSYWFSFIVVLSIYVVQVHTKNAPVPAQYDKKGKFDTGTSMPLITITPDGNQVMFLQYFSLDQVHLWTGLKQTVRKQSFQVNDTQRSISLIDLKFSPSGEYVVLASSQGSIYLYNLFKNYSLDLSTKCYQNIAQINVNSKLTLRMGKNNKIALARDDFFVVFSIPKDKGSVLIVDIAASLGVNMTGLTWSNKFDDILYIALNNGTQQQIKIYNSTSKKILGTLSETSTCITALPSTFFGQQTDDLVVKTTGDGNLGIFAFNLDTKIFSLLSTITDSKYCKSVSFNQDASYLAMSTSSSVFVWRTQIIINAYSNISRVKSYQKQNNLNKDSKNTNSPLPTTITFQQILNTSGLGISLSKSGNQVLIHSYDSNANIQRWILCQQEYYLSNDSCIKCSPECPTCIYSPTTCSSCPVNTFYLQLSTSKCIKCSTTFRGCQICGNKYQSVYNITCLQCNKTGNWDYPDSSGNCKCLQYCMQPNAQATQCVAKKGYTLDTKNKCIQCDDRMNCLRCTNTSYCNQCNEDKRFKAKPENGKCLCQDTFEYAENNNTCNCPVGSNIVGEQCVKEEVFQWWKIVVLVGGIGVLAVVAFVCLKKRRNKLQGYQYNSSANPSMKEPLTNSGQNTASILTEDKISNQQISRNDLSDQEYQQKYFQSNMRVKPIK